MTTIIVLARERRQEARMRERVRAGTVAPPVETRAAPLVPFLDPPVPRPVAVARGTRAPPGRP